MSKQSMREEAERLIREAMARKPLVVKQGNTRIEAVCGKCGAPNRILAEKGATRFLNLNLIRGLSRGVEQQ